MITHEWQQNGHAVRIQKPLFGTWTVLIDGIALACGIRFKRYAKRIVNYATQARRAV